MKLSIMIPTILTLLLIACGEEESPIEPVVESDCSVANLTASAEGDSIRLQWSAPESSDRLAAYDIRSSLVNPDTVSHWWANSATPVDNSLEPANPGALQSLAVGVDTTAPRFFFAIRSQKRDGWWSPLSNVASIEAPRVAGVVTRPLRKSRASGSYLDTIPANRATVRIKDELAAADRLGKFQTSVPHGSHAMLVRREGHEDLDTTVLFDRPRYLNLIMSPNVSIEFPDPIADFEGSVRSQNMIALQWKVPGDVWGRPLARYEIRYVLGETITDSLWSSATRLSQTIPVPGTPGTIDSIVIVDLAIAPRYSFAVRSIDSSGNVSPLSPAYTRPSQSPLTSAPVTFVVRRIEPIEGYWRPVPVDQYAITLAGETILTGSNGVAYFPDVPFGTNELLGTHPEHEVLSEVLSIDDTLSQELLVEPGQRDDYIPLAVGNRYLYEYSNSYIEFKGNDSRSQGTLFLEIVSEIDSGDTHIFRGTVVDSGANWERDRDADWEVRDEYRNERLLNIHVTDDEVSFHDWPRFPGPALLPRLQPSYFPDVIWTPGSVKMVDFLEPAHGTAFERGIGMVETWSDVITAFFNSSAYHRLLDATIMAD